MESKLASKSFSLGKDFFMPINNIIENIINKWDPIDLISSCSPKDEYQYEIYILSDWYYNNIANLTGLADAIYNTFIESFGGDVFCKTYDDCKKVAMAIIAQMN